MSTTDRVNSYYCPMCQRSTVTVDRDTGVTAFTIRCRATPDCRGLATSRFYLDDVTGPPTHEWYSPTQEERQLLDEEMQAHVRRGGLVLREILKPAEPSAAD